MQEKETGNKLDLLGDQFMEIQSKLTKAIQLGSAETYRWFAAKYLAFSKQVMRRVAKDICFSKNNHPKDG